MRLSKDQRRGLVFNRIPFIAEIFDMTPGTVNKWISIGMPRDEVGSAENIHSRWEYDVLEIIRWLRGGGPWTPKNRTAGATAAPLDNSGMTDAELMAIAPDTPGMERYRAAKADLAEMDVNERRGKLCAVDIATPLASQCSSIMRSVGDQLETRYDSGAKDILNEALDSCRKLLINARNALDVDTGRDDLGIRAVEGPESSVDESVG